MKLNLTEVGKSFLLDCMAGGPSPQFCKITMGNGADAGKEATEMSNPVKELDIIDMTRDGDFVTLTAVLNNNTIEARFKETEMGVYILDPYEDSGTGVILFAYGYVPEDEAAVIPAAADYPFETVQKVMVYVGDAEDITAVFSESEALATKEELQNHTNDMDNPHQVDCEKIGAVSVDEFEGAVTQILNDYGLVEHLADEDNPHGVTIEKIGAAPALHGIGQLQQFNVATYAGTTDDVLALNDAQIDAVLREQIDSMVDQSFKRFVLSFKNSGNFTGGGGHYYADVYKLNPDFSIITLKSYIFRGRTIHRVLTKETGETEPTFKPWEWDNPLFMSGREYRTTERIDGEAIVKKYTSSGKLQYRRHSQSEYSDYAGLFGAAPAGYGGYGEVLAYSFQVEDEADMEDALDDIVDAMLTNTSMRIEFTVAKLGDNISLGGSWTWAGTIVKTSSNYAMLTAQCGFGHRVAKITKYLSAGTWKPVEWVDPPLELSVEYRTTKRFYGEPVYVKLVNFGSISDFSKSVYIADYVGDVVEIGGYWYSSAKTSKQPFAFANFIQSVIVGQEISGGKTTWKLLVASSEKNNGFYGLPVVYYTKRTV